MCTVGGQGREKGEGDWGGGGWIIDHCTQLLYKAYTVNNGRGIIGHCTQLLYEAYTVNNGGGIIDHCTQLFYMYMAYLVNNGLGGGGGGGGSNWLNSLVRLKQ